jgi:hypothetical protein
MRLDPTTKNAPINPVEIGERSKREIDAETEPSTVAATPISYVQKTRGGKQGKKKKKKKKKKATPRY